MTDIKPIETVYNGYRFRSRLEARWAVFFDALGIEYEYEPEGYKFSDGQCYLPDFYLSNLNTFVEIKRLHDFEIAYDHENNMVACDLGKSKYLEFASKCTKSGMAFLIAFGDPVDVFFSEDHGGHDSGHLFFNAECTAHFLVEHHPDIEVKCDAGNDCKACTCYSNMASATSFAVAFFDDGPIWITITDDENILPSDNMPVLSLVVIESHEEAKKHFLEIDLQKNIEAAYKARQARFEHGEIPKI